MYTWHWSRRLWLQASVTYFDMPGDATNKIISIYGCSTKWIILWFERINDFFDVLLNQIRYQELVLKGLNSSTFDVVQSLVNLFRNNISLVKRKQYLIRKYASRLQYSYVNSSNISSVVSTQSFRSGKFSGSIDEKDAKNKIGIVNKTVRETELTDAYEIAIQVSIQKLFTTIKRSFKLSELN